MKTPFFSICVPTRNRHETLIHCVRTLIEQNFEDYEILISDNSDEESAAINKKNIDELNCPKIIYYKQDTFLSMTQNFEFVVSKARGEYVMCLGDDDGMVVNTLQKVYGVISETKALAIKCINPFYYWYGSVDYPNSHFTYPVNTTTKEVYSKDILKNVANFSNSFFDLPMIYYGFISRSIINKVIEKQGSFFGNTASVDMYSGLCVSYFTEKYLITNFPFSIAGLSAKGNGSNQFSNKTNEIVDEHIKSHNVIDYYEKYSLPFIQNDISIFTWLELCRFKDVFKLSDSELQIDNSKILINSIQTDNVWNNVSAHGETVSKFLSYSEKYFNKIEDIKRNFFNGLYYYPSFLYQYTEIIKNQPIDPILFGIKNIYDAALFCQQISDAHTFHRPIPLKNYKGKMKASLLSRLNNKLGSVIGYKIARSN